MKNLSAIALLLLLASGAALAQEQHCGIPRPTAEVQPRHYSVDLATAPVLSYTATHCADAQAACSSAGGEVTVSEVMGVFTAGDYACVLFVVPDDPWLLAYRAGYLPLSMLTPVPAGNVDWSGTWSRRLQAATIVMTNGEGGTVHIEGLVSNTEKTANNVARNLYREDLISEDVVTRKAALEFEQNEDDIAAPYQGEFEGCSVRMWRGGPYLLVSDNPYCGAPDVSFSGLYLRE